MTEIAVPQAATPEAADKLVAWAKAAHAAHQIATSLVQTSFVPKQYQGKPAEATAAILAGAELGFDPMASLRTFDNIQGTAAPKAITIRAVVQSHGHELDVIEETPTRAVARYRRKGQADYRTVEWTIERANQMGLPAKNPNWKSNPQAMLVARATAEAGRRCASDALLGIPYSSEELHDSAEPVQVPSKRVTAAEIVGKREAPAQSAPVPADPVASQPELPVEEPPTDPDWPEVAQPGGTR
jgi:hypothetical protein